MSKSILIKHGMIYEKKWNSELRNDELWAKPHQTLSDILQCPVELEETTFEKFFQLILAELPLFQQIFNGALYGWSLDSYAEEFQKTPHPEDVASDLDHVEVYWSADLFEGELSLGPGFHGWGDWKTVDAPTKGGMAIEYTPLHHYKHKLLKLNTEVHIQDMKDREGKNVVKAKQDFTVYDVINAILFEITWAGDVSHRDAQKKEIFDRADEAKEYLDRKKKDENKEEENK